MSGVWPEPTKLGSLGRGPVRSELIADAAALERIAKALDLPAVERLEAAISLKPWLDGAELSARWRATVIQTCGVSLEQFSQDLQGEFTLRLVPPGSDAAPRDGAEINVHPDEDDPPEVMEGDVIDSGAYVIEHLALELDPFPRKPGVEFEPPAEETPESPFSVLRKLKGPDAV